MEFRDQEVDLGRKECQIIFNEQRASVQGKDSGFQTVKSRTRDLFTLVLLAFYFGLMMKAQELENESHRVYCREVCSFSRQDWIG